MVAVRQRLNDQFLRFFEELSNFEPDVIDLVYFSQTVLTLTYLITVSRL